MNMLTYISNNDKKRKSFSSDGSETPEDSPKHHKIVININNPLSQERINECLNPYSTNNRNNLYVGQSLKPQNDNRMLRSYDIIRKVFKKKLKNNNK